MRYGRDEEVIEYVQDNDIKFIRMQFCDMNGALRNLSVMPTELERAFDEGISFDPSGVPGFVGSGGEELTLHPDPSTMVPLPWRPQHGRVVRLLCGIRHMDGRPYVGDGRAACARESENLRGAGLLLRAATSCTFSLFRIDEQGAPTLIPHDNADAYAVAPLDRGENVRREICLTLEEMDIQACCSFHSHGPGQHEIGLRGNAALSAADHHITFVSAARTIAERNGLHATMMPRPLPGGIANRLKLDLALESVDTIIGKRLSCDVVESFWTGVQDGLREIYAFIGATTNFYPQCEIAGADAVLRWNEKRPLKIVHGRDGSMFATLDCADPSANPYLMLALIQAAGMCGVERKLKVEQEQKRELPSTLEEALSLAGNSALCRETLGGKCLHAYLEQRGEDCAAWNAAPAPKLDWERQRYFFVM